VDLARLVLRDESVHQPRFAQAAALLDQLCKRDHLAIRDRGGGERWWGIARGCKGFAGFEKLWYIPAR
jgi:hypothetical protein